ncbi:MAG: L-glutamate gamma-semialdehyde dehydrogenase [candidate division Zixibacteria bacterium]|nr:L-glutamate gamma-semialdehyde dehydrogenase [candidate division Zixibacteria bacterium]
MTNYRIPQPTNEPVKSYAPGSPEREMLKKALGELKSKQIEVPLVIDGKEIRTDKKVKITAPHDHNLVLGYAYHGTKKEFQMAIDSALKAQKMWATMPTEQRVAIFLKAADLLAGPYRYIMNAATMLAHSKNAFQAEIDAVCELVDFFRFNAYYMQMISDIQPINPDPTIWNRLDYRPLEGFIFAITPFNFVSINGNLPTAPAMWGNVAVWKPARSVLYTSHFIMKILMEAGLPAGVINFVTGNSSEISEVVLNNENLAGIHFTGSTAVFQSMWKTIGENIAKYKTYPRIVGETGGKDFIFVHQSANPFQVATAITRGAFEYQGQKCSAASRVYIPKSLWLQVKEILLKQISQIKMGDPCDFTNFMNAIIDKSAFDSIKVYIDYTRKTQDAKIIAGGNCDESKGYFIDATVIETTNPKFKTMEEEIFGPVITIYVYEDTDYEKTLHLCDQTSPYALTGAVFATDRKAIEIAETILRNAAGNFYINDKPTGAVVSQQPFGGARASGTNDKAGALHNMIRWTSPRSVKENLLPPIDFKYPFMGQP